MRRRSVGGRGLVLLTTAAVLGGAAGASGAAPPTTALPDVAPGRPPAPRHAPRPRPAPAPLPRVQLSRSVVIDVQRALVRRGARGIRVDGRLGRQTRHALASFARRANLRTGARVTPRLLTALGIGVRTPTGEGVGRVRIPATTVAAAPAVPPAPGASPDPARRGPRPAHLVAFPVAGPNDYEPSFGAPRHQGAHEGTDIMARRGVPVVAVADGTVVRMTRVETGLGGLWVWLQDRAGTQFYYAHLSAVAPSLAPGSRVSAGQALGAVGNTGDARWGDPHLHFEIHPGGGDAVDPYPELVVVDPDPPVRAEGSHSAPAP